MHASKRFRACAAAAVAVLVVPLGASCAGKPRPAGTPVTTEQSVGDGTRPPANPFLAAPVYGITHIDSSQSDTFPYPAPRGTFRVDPRTQPRSAGGPINIMTLASTSPDYMWVASTSGVRYVDVRDGGFTTVAQAAAPGEQAVPAEKLDSVLAQRFTDIEQVRRAVEQDMKLSQRVLGNGTYTLVDRDNRMYYTTADSEIVVYELVDPADPAAGISVVNTLDYKPFFAPSAPGDTRPQSTVGLAMTYDGHLVVVTTRGIGVINRDLIGTPSAIEFGPDEIVSNSVSVDGNGGIYVASDKIMRKLVWTGTELSQDAASGAWSAPYDVGTVQPPAVKFGNGTGSTPTLMGFGDDADKLVVITDGSDQMKLVAFWRDQIPAGSNRIAGQIPVTAGLNPAPPFIQSEQSVVVNGYGAFVVNNIRPEGVPDRLEDVIAGGPVFAPPQGMERFEWDQAGDAWRSVWARPDVVSTSMVPAASSQTGSVMVNGYTPADGWEVTGLDWNTGETVQRIIFGQDNLGNGAYAIIEFMPNGDLLFNSIGGPFRARLGG